MAGREAGSAWRGVMLAEIFAAGLILWAGQAGGVLQELRPGECGWLLQYVGLPATEAMRYQRFAALRDGPLSI